MGRFRGGTLAVLALVALGLFAGGFFAVGALGRQSADSPLIVLDQSIGGVSIGMTEAQVVALYGAPDSTLVIVLRGGGTGKLVRYRVHGGLLIITYASGRVVSIETTSSFFRTKGGIGPGSGVPDLPGFHLDFCSLGLWNGDGSTGPGGVVTILERNGDEVGGVIVTQLGYYDLCLSTGVEQEVADPRPSTFQLHAGVEPDGGGFVRSSPVGIDCPVDCATQFGKDSTITLAATPTNGFTFEGWGGACSGVGSCVVTMDGPKSVSARFTGTFVPPPPPPPTTTTKPGSE